MNADVPTESTSPNSRAPVVCAHCGLDVPRGLIDEASELQFCCAGCRTVYEVIHSCGLEKFYRLQEQADVEASPARTTGRAYAELDDRAFLDATSSVVAPRVRSVELYLEGIHCAACVWLVERLPRVLPGVIEARLDLRRALVRVTWDERAVALSGIASALDSLGYPPHPARDVRVRESRLREDRRFLIRIAAAGVGAGNVMLLAFALYGGAYHGRESEYGALFRWTSMIIGLVTLIGPGAVFYRGAWAALRTRTAHLDLPIALGITVGAVTGTVNTILGRGEIYFDSLTVLVFLLLVGRWIQHRQQRWTSDALELLFSFTPSFARIVDGDERREVSVEAIRPGQVCEVHAGESFPTDGVVIGGESSVDESLLTGESRPVTVQVDSRVFAGAVNLSRPIRVRVDAVGRETRVGRLMDMVEEYTRRKAPIVQMADRLAGWFVVGVMALAAATFVVWVGVDASQAVDNAASLLIVTCPCALGLATPLAVAVAIGRAAKRGILVKGGDAFELLARPSRIYLDKTGTLTESTLRLVQWHGDETVRPWVAAVESGSSHPVAHALASSEEADPAVRVESVSQTAGAGIEGIVAGRTLTVGSPEFVHGHVREVPQWLEDVQRGVISRCLTPIWIGLDDRVVAMAGIGNPIRQDASEAVRELRRQGWRVGILSGDAPEVVASVASALGVERGESHGGMTPEAKLARIESEMVCGSVVMVGDGVNDAAALSAATVGIAVHGGAEASLSAADVYLSRPGLRPIVELLGASSRTVRTIHRSLAVSLAYNGVAATLAVTGTIGPLLAAVLMPISSFSVLAMAVGARTFSRT